MAKHRIKYELKPEHTRKLRSLIAEEQRFNKAAEQAWRNEEYRAAKVAMCEANLAHARMLAYFDKLAGWQENGVVTDGYAK